LADPVAWPTLGAPVLKDPPKDPKDPKEPKESKEAKEHPESNESQPKEETKKDKGDKPKKSMYITHPASLLHIVSSSPYFT
jgi:hypothetical protein